MSLIAITVQPTSSVTHFDTAVLLDGARYRFSFYTDSASDGWAFDVSNDDETSIVRGLALSVGPDLLAPYRHLDMPPGYLFVHDQESSGTDPTQESFSEGRVALYYLGAT